MRETPSRREALRKISGTGAAAMIGVAARGVIDVLKVGKGRRTAEEIECGWTGREK